MSHATRGSNRLTAGHTIGASYARPLAAIAGLAMGIATAFGQPLDVNQIQPSATPPVATDPSTTAPDRPAEATGTAPAAPEAQPADANAAADAAARGGKMAQDADVFNVTAFRFSWQFPDREGQGDLQEIVNASVAKLSVADDGAYVAAQPDRETVLVRVGDIGASGAAKFYLSGISAVAQAVSDEVNRRKLVGVVVVFDAEDVNPEGGPGKQDLHTGAPSEVDLFVWTREVSMVRTIALGDRLEKLDPKINPADRVHERIRSQSPLQAGSLLTRQELDDFVFRLNRHPGRRVDVALAGGDEPGQVVLDYLVNESKPWALYAQLSNTGTKSTGVWRERFGFTHNQLTGHDDVLRVDYITSGFEDANAVNASYDFPLLSDKIRTRVFGSYSEFTASDLGLAQEQFSGETYAGGFEVTGIIWQRGEWFLDLTGGLRLANISVTNDLTVQEGQSTFMFPYVGMTMSRFTDENATFINATLEYNLSDAVLGQDKDEVANLGRQDVADEWTVLKFSAEHSFYLDRWIGAMGMSGPENREAKEPTMRRWPTLAHEISLALRGQYAFGDRLVAQEEEVAGGLFSVRGYPESAAAGDSVLIASAEYRFHLPRLFPVSDPGFLGAKEMGWSQYDFRWAPQQEYGRADWDLIFRGFVDVGQTVISDPRAGETDETLVGVGIGAELQVKRNLNFRLDWGFALEEVGSEQQDDLVKSGNNEVHFSATLLY